MFGETLTNDFASNMDNLEREEKNNLAENEKKNSPKCDN